MSLFAVEYRVAVNRANPSRFIITFCTLFKLLIIICWMPWKQWFTASGPCLVVIKRFNSPRDHFKSVVSLSYALSFF